MTRVQSVFACLLTAAAGLACYDSGGLNGQAPGQGGQSGSLAAGGAPESGGGGRAQQWCGRRCRRVVRGGRRGRGNDLPSGGVSGTDLFRRISAGRFMRLSFLCSSGGRRGGRGQRWHEWRRSGRARRREWRCRCGRSGGRDLRRGRSLSCSGMRERRGDRPRPLRMPSVCSGGRSRGPEWRGRRWGGGWRKGRAGR